MIFLDMQQGSPQWLQARAKRITASCFADAVSRVGGLDDRQAKYVALVRGGMAIPDAVKEAGYKAAPSSDTVRRALLGEETSEHSDTAKRYAADLAIERISGYPHGEPPKAWVLDRGHELEVRARMLYEARTRSFVTESGICISDDGVFAYSSDGLVDEDGLIEIKAPIDSIKIMEMWRTGDTSEYDHQIQGGMWLTGRAWCDFIMFVPDLAAAGKDLYVKRIYRDDAFIDKMVEQLVEFDRLVDSYTIILRADTMPITTIEENMQTETPVQESLIPAPNLTSCAGYVVSFGKTSIPPALRLGQISERLGFTVSADFLLTLGFAPAATEKNSKLFHEADFARICAALLRHITTVQAAH